MAKKEKKAISIDNPKGFAFRGTSFNEFQIAGMSTAEWIKFAKVKFGGEKPHPFFGNRADEKQQEEYLTHVHKIATDMVGKTEAKAEAKPEKPAK